MNTKYRIRAVSTGYNLLEFKSYRWKISWKNFFIPKKEECWRLVPSPDRTPTEYYHCYIFNMNDLSEYVHRYSFFACMYYQHGGDDYKIRDFIKKYQNIQDYFDENKKKLEKPKISFSFTELN